MAGDLYRAEAKRRHSGRPTSWKGKWRPDPDRAIAQARRWRLKEPFAEITVVSYSRMKTRGARGRQPPLWASGQLPRAGGTWPDELNALEASNSRLPVSRRNRLETH